MVLCHFLDMGILRSLLEQCIDKTEERTLRQRQTLFTKKQSSAIARNPSIFSVLLLASDPRPEREVPFSRYLFAVIVKG